MKATPRGLHAANPCYDFNPCWHQFVQSIGYETRLPVLRVHRVKASTKVEIQGMHFHGVNVNATLHLIDNNYY